jgi:uncharacterized protein YaaN involved in tellurite resistance
MTDERTGEEQETAETAVSRQSDALPMELRAPAVPKVMSADDAEEVQRQAEELVQRLEDAAGAEELELLDSVTSAGLEAGNNAAGQLDLLKTRMGTFLDEGGTGGEIAEELRNLRLSLNQINPQEVTDQSVVNRLLGVLPVVRTRYNPVVRALSKIAIRYEPMSRQIVMIEDKLRDDRAILVRDNIELRKLYEDVELQQLPIQRNVYLGELLAQHLARIMEQTDDPARRDRIEIVLEGVLTRVQNLRTVIEVHAQYFLAIEMSWHNNNRLGQSVDQTLLLATNVVTVGLALQSALIRQRRVAEVARRMREFLGDLVTANAGSILQHTQEIGDLYTNPVIPMEKINQAHSDLIEALDVAGQMRQKGIKDATENIAVLSKKSAELEEKLGRFGSEGLGAIGQGEDQAEGQSALEQEG